MEAFFTVVFIIILIVLGFILIGFWLMSRLVGGFGNLRALYRLFKGKGVQGARHNTAKTSGSARSERTNNKKSHATANGNVKSASGKMFEHDEGTYVDFEEVK